MSPVRPDLTLLVPCFNEGLRIDPLLAAVQAWIAERPPVQVELLCVDDGSLDDTASRLKTGRWEAGALRVLTLPENAGKGRALATGMAAARGRTVLFLDADLAVDLRHVDTALEVLEAGADVVVGCRNVPGARLPKRQGRVRRWLGRGYRWLACRLLGLHVSDVTCGFKAFRREVGQLLFARARCSRWGFDAEILFLAERSAFDIREMPVAWSHGEVSAVRLGRDVFGALGELLGVRLRHAFRSVPRLQRGHGEPLTSGSDPDP